MRPPYTTIFDPGSTEEEVKEAREEILQEIAEAQHQRDDTEYFYNVWQNLHEATEKALENGDDELHDYLKNNWEIMELHAEEELQP
jgi:transcription termination factor NusB